MERARIVSGEKLLRNIMLDSKIELYAPYVSQPNAPGALIVLIIFSTFFLLRTCLFDWRYCMNFEFHCLWFLTKIGKGDELRRWWKLRDMHCGGKTLDSTIVLFEFLEVVFGFLTCRKLNSEKPQITQVARFKDLLCFISLIDQPPTNNKNIHTNGSNKKRTPGYTWKSPRWVKTTGKNQAL